MIYIPRFPGLALLSRLAHPLEEGDDHGIAHPIAHNLYLLREQTFVYI